MDLGRTKALLASSANPRATIQSLAEQGNPAAAQALTYLQNGITAKQAVINILNQRGIPLQAFMQNPLFKL